jgi:hypothetical protein
LELAERFSPCKEFVDVASTDTTETLRRRTENFSSRYELRFSIDDFPNHAPVRDRRWSRYFDATAYGELVRAELFRRRSLTIRAMEIVAGDALMIAHRLYYVTSVLAESSRVVLDVVDRIAPRCFPRMNLNDSMARNTAFATSLRREYQPRELVAVARSVRLAGR